jgi:hypothetical protein
MSTKISILLFSLYVLTFTACKKEGLNPLTDFRPVIPVTVSNVFDYRPNPTVKASKADDKITITLEIPQSSGRTIKEITKVAAAATANFTPLQTATTVSTNGLYTNTPIPGNGRSVTFETTLTEYRTKTATTTATASNALLPRAFYFLITLDNGETIIPQFVRVWVVD